MFLTCTYEGTRQYRGENQAVISLKGILKARQFSRNQAGGKVSGRVHFAIDQGFVSLAQLKVQSEGTAQIGNDEVAVSRTMNVDVSRAAGNTTGLVARDVPVPPPAGAAPLRVAQGKSVLQTNLVLGAADPANHPAKPGCTFKIVNADFTAGKTYIIEMIKTDASVLDPFLLLYNPKGQLVAKDDDSAGNLNARIVHTAQESGSYRIHATTLVPGMFGSVQVRVYEGIGSALAKGPAAPVQPVQPGPAAAPVTREAPPPGWAEFSPNDRSFSVWVPQQGGRRSTRQRNFTVRGLRLKVNIIQFDANNGPLFSASTLQFPPQVLRGLPLQKRIEAFRDMFLEEVKGRVEEETELKQGRVPGREYVVSTGQGQARLRVYALGGRVYRAVVIGTQQQVQGNAANTFLDSFRLPSAATTGIPAVSTPAAPGGNPANVGQRPGIRPPPGNPVPPAGALNMIGDVFAFAAAAVKENRLADVDLRGFKLHKEEFRQILDEGAVLIGFQVGYGQFVNKRTINAIRPIFLTKSGEKMGSWHGPASPNPVIVKAKEGYVVGSMSIRTALAIDGFSIKFIKLTKNGIDPADNYDSEWVGGNGGRPETIGAQGGLFVGICGKLDRQGVPGALGLVAALPK